MSACAAGRRIVLVSMAVVSLALEMPDCPPAAPVITLE